MTFVNTQISKKIKHRIVGNVQEYVKGTRTRQIPALATLLYVDWIPQVNGPPPALPSYIVDHKSAISVKS